MRLRSAFAIGFLLFLGSVLALPSQALAPIRHRSFHLSPPASAKSIDLTTNTPTTVPITVPASDPIPATIGLTILDQLPPEVLARAYCIRDRESHGDYQAQNPSSTASGAWQFLDSSWIAYGGSQFTPRAWMATPAQQDQVFLWAYAQSGLSPWAGGGYSC